MKVRDRVNSLGDWNIKMNGDEILSSRYLKYTNKEQVERVMDAYGNDVIYVGMDHDEWSEYRKKFENQ